MVWISSPWRCESWPTFAIPIFPSKKPLSLPLAWLQPFCVSWAALHRRSKSGHSHWRPWDKSFHLLLDLRWSLVYSTPAIPCLYDLYEPMASPCSIQKSATNKNDPKRDASRSESLHLRPNPIPHSNRGDTATSEAMLAFCGLLTNNRLTAAPVFRNPAIASWYGKYPNIYKGLYFLHIQTVGCLGSIWGVALDIRPAVLQAVTPQAGNSHQK